jgi:Peptidase family M23
MQRKTSPDEREDQPMSAPNLTISLEPFESGKVVYLPLAAKTANDKPNAQLALKVSIKNNENKVVHVKQFKISFVGPPSVSAVTIPVNLDIASKVSADWFFSADQNIILPVPAPGMLQLSLSCDGFDTTVDLTLPLAAHKSPTPAQSYAFPGRVSDLRLGEYWSGVSAKHGAAGDGSQLFAYDMGVIAWDADRKQFTSLLPGQTDSKNEDFRIWGKPIYAVADGTVVDFRNDIPTNPSPPADPSPPHPVEGNHFYIQHRDELVLYAHFQPGSLNANLMTVGAKVKERDFLGLAGNSGNSTAPHLHMHVIQATKPWSGPLRPLPFHDIQVVDQTVLHPPDPTGPWVKVDDQGLPNVASAIWPTATTPTWYPPGWAEVARHGIPEASYQQPASERLCHHAARSS